MSFLLRRLVRYTPRQFERSVHTTCSCSRFYESSPKGEWRDQDEYDRMEQEQRAQMRKNWYGLKDGFKDVRAECWKWKDEWVKRLTDDSQMHIQCDDWLKFWTFDTPENCSKWQTAADADHNIGYSYCELTSSPTGHGLFQGYINSKVAREGRATNAGYCNITSHRPIKSFNRPTYHNMSSFTHFIMRVRGDGRRYLINLLTPGDIDILWNDSFHYPLYTRGGPYWQFVKIPFSKFVFASKGCVQDAQFPLQQNKIASVGITVGHSEGPFCLEIDYIGAVNDPRDKATIQEEHAYEMYRSPYGMAG